MDRRAFAATSGSVLGGFLSGCVTGTPLSPDVTASETRRYDVADGTALRVRNRDGSVSVEGYDGDAVEVEIRKSGRTEEALERASVTATEAGGELRIRTESDGREGERRVSVSLSIRCPETVGVAEAATTNGSVTVSDVTGDATLESENGSVTAERVDGTVSLSTTNGSATARDVGEVARAVTANGSIEVGVPELTDDATVRTTNGGIDAAITPDLDATVTATTTSGSVEVDGLDFSSVASSSGRFEGVLGDGTHALRIETTNSSIDLTALSA